MVRPRVRCLQVVEVTGSKIRLVAPFLTPVYKHQFLLKDRPA